MYSPKQTAVCNRKTNICVAPEKTNICMHQKNKHLYEPEKDKCLGTTRKKNMHPRATENNVSKNVSKCTACTRKNIPYASENKTGAQTWPRKQHLNKIGVVRSVWV